MPFYRIFILAFNGYFFVTPSGRSVHFIKLRRQPAHMRTHKGVQAEIVCRFWLRLLQFIHAAGDISFLAAATQIVRLCQNLKRPARVVCELGVVIPHQGRTHHAPCVGF